MENYNSQESMVLKHLKTGSLTPLEALHRYGIFRLGARIFDLRTRGYPIEREWVHNNGKKFASYHMRRVEKQVVMFI